MKSARVCWALGINPFFSTTLKPHSRTSPDPGSHHLLPGPLQCTPKWAPCLWSGLCSMPPPSILNTSHRAAFLKLTHHTALLLQAPLLFPIALEIKSTPSHGLRGLATWPALSLVNSSLQSPPHLCLPLFQAMIPCPQVQNWLSFKSLGLLRCYRP